MLAASASATKNLFMKTFAALLLFTVCSFCICQAQKPLTNSRTSGYYTYIYQLKDADVELFYKGKESAITDKLLLHPVDSVLTDKFRMPQLRPGNYLKVAAEKNKLNYNLVENHSAFLNILDNRKDLRFVLLDVNGKEINSALVYLNKKRVEYDARLQLYHTQYAKNDTLLKVKYAEVSNYFAIVKQKRYQYRSRPAFWRSMVYNTPLRYLWVPLKKLLSNNHNSYHPSPYTGYMVFNKPVYKPGDTVKFKAYVFNRNNKAPVKQRSLFVRLTEHQSGDKGKIIGTVNSYRAGAFESSLVLNDSLKLILDNN